MSKNILKNQIESKIHIVRDQRVMLDADLANLYEVTVSALNQSVRRNSKRFPPEFAFRLNKKEWISLRSQIVILKKKKGRHTKYAPYVFTEHGVAMLSSVLKSEKAIDVNIAIINVFIELREMLTSHKKLAAKLSSLERKYDGQFKVVFEAIRQMMKPSSKKGRIGF